MYLKKNTKMNISYLNIEYQLGISQNYSTEINIVGMINWKYFHVYWSLKENNTMYLISKKIILPRDGTNKK